MDITANREESYEPKEDAKIKRSPKPEDILSAAGETTIPKYKLPRGWKTVERLQDNPYASWKKVDLPKKDNKMRRQNYHGEEEQKKGMNRTRKAVKK